MKVLMITQWKNPGFSYSHFLADSLRKIGIDLAILEWDYPPLSKKKILAPLLRLRELLSYFTISEVIHVQYTLGMYHVLFLPIVVVIKLFTRKKLVITLHEHYLYRDINNVLSKIVRLYLWFFCSFASLIIVHSNSEKELLPLSLKKKAVKIPHGVVYKEDDSNEQKRGDNLILLAGVITRHKGHKIAINAMEKIVKVKPDAKLYIVGSPPPKSVTGLGKDEQYLPELRKLVKSKGLENNVIFITKFLDNKEFLDFFKKCTIAVLPYPKETTSSGILADVFSNSIPAVMTDAPVFREHTKNKAIYFSNGDHNELADKMLDLLKDRKRREEMSEEFRKLAKEYSWENVAKEHIRVYKKLLNQDGAR